MTEPELDIDALIEQADAITCPHCQTKNSLTALLKVQNGSCWRCSEQIPELPDPSVDPMVEAYIKNENDYARVTLIYVTVFALFLVCGLLWYFLVIVPNGK